MESQQPGQSITFTPDAVLLSFSHYMLRTVGLQPVILGRAFLPHLVIHTFLFPSHLKVTAMNICR